MFFIGVFGINQKMSEIKELPPMMCKSCRQTERFTLMKCYQQFHFFFLPILSGIFVILSGVHRVRW